MALLLGAIMTLTDRALTPDDIYDLVYMGWFYECDNVEAAALNVNADLHTRHVCMEARAMLYDRLPGDKALAAVMRCWERARAEQERARRDVT